MTAIEVPSHLSPTLSLWNPIGQTSFAMRYNKMTTWRSGNVTIAGGSDALLAVLLSCTVRDLSVATAELMRDLRVDLIEGNVRSVGDARLAAFADGEPLLGADEKGVGVLLRKHLGKDIPVVRAPQGKSFLFSALDSDKWLGYFLPHGTRIDVKVTGLPANPGPLTLEVRHAFWNYTANMD